VLKETTVATTPSPIQSASKEVEMIKVASTSRSTAVAGAIAGVMRERHAVEMQAVGAAAVNQAVKALAIARDYLTEDGINLVCVPKFSKIEINGQERTAMRFSIATRD
jgi:stage V sporulation protein S